MRKSCENIGQTLIEITCIKTSEHPTCEAICLWHVRTTARLEELTELSTSFWRPYAPL